MDEVKIKAHNRDYYVYCSLEHESVFFNMLETKLKACVRGDHTLEAFFLLSSGTDIVADAEASAMCK